MTDLITHRNRMWEIKKKEKKGLRILLGFLSLITERVVVLFMENGSSLNRVNGQ